MLALLTGISVWALPIGAVLDTFTYDRQSGPWTWMPLVTTLESQPTVATVDWLVSGAVLAELAARAASRGTRGALPVVPLAVRKVGPRPHDPRYPTGRSST